MGVLDKVWIHQLNEARDWQQRNAHLLWTEYQADPTPDRLADYIESYGRYREYAGRCEQWHIDYREFKETGEL